MNRSLSLNSSSLPFKSVAGALLFSIFFGPIGALYASVLGGSILLVLATVAFVGKFYIAFALFWMMACVLSVAMTNRYNKKILQSHERYL